MSPAATPARVYACRAGELPEGGRRIVALGDGRSAGVFRIRGQLLAYENACRHQGGPVCEGELMPAIEAVVDGDGRVLTERSNPDRPHLVCPWHGWEYELPSGRAVGLPQRALTRFEVVDDGGVLYLVVPPDGDRAAP